MSSQLFRMILLITALLELKFLKILQQFIKSVKSSGLSIFFQQYLIPMMYMIIGVPAFYDRGTVLLSCSLLSNDDMPLLPL